MMLPVVIIIFAIEFGQVFIMVEKINLKAIYSLFIKLNKSGYGCESVGVLLFV